VTVVTIKHREFSYRVPILDDDGEQVVKTTKHGREVPKYRRSHAYRRQQVDIPLDEDVERGVAFGAFYTEDELNAMAGGEVEVEATGSNEVPSDLNYDDQGELVTWIKESKPNAQAVIDAAQNDPDKAIALMDAEEEATGGQPRKTVMSGLQKIANE
jgi:hypothetical protein